MSQYYNPKRKSDWNYGGAKWKLSRSKIDLFLECPRCFYIDNKLGTKRPPGYPLTLNVAVDELFKKEFDIHRSNNTAHPLMDEYHIDAVPFQHKDIDVWRDNFNGVQYKHVETNMIISGAIDDVWIDNKTQDLIVVDYKATSKSDAIHELDLSLDLHKQYKRQMEVYQWLLRKNGFAVSDTGYFVYANGRKDSQAFDARLEFDVTLVPLVGNDSWIDATIVKIKKCLEDERVPKFGAECDYCPYREVVGRALQEKMGKVAQPDATRPTPSRVYRKKTPPPDTGTLF